MFKRLLLFALLLIPALGQTAANAFVNKAILSQRWPAYCSQAQSFFARIPGSSAARKQAYNTLICGLVTAGVWSKLDVFYVLAATDQQTALTNLVSSKFNGSVVGTPTFIANSGYVGQNGAGTYLDSGFDPTVGSPNFTLNSSSIFAYRATMPGGDAGGFAGIYQNTFLLALTNFYGASSGGYVDPTGSGSTIGLFEATRSNSTQLSLYIDGAGIVLDSAVSSQALNTGYKLQLLNDGLGRNTGSTSLVSSGGVGAGLTDADSRNLSNYLSQYSATIAGTPGPQLAFSSDIVADGNNNYTPGLARLADGRLIATYCIGAGTQNNAILVYRTSSDNGKTWSAATTIATPASSHTYSDSSVTVLANGSVLVSVMDEDSPSVETEIFIGTVQTNLSISWSAPISVAALASSSYVLPLPNGQLMLGLYSTSAGNASVIFSSDGGNTWSGQETVATEGSGTVWTEANYVVLGTSIYGVLRNSGTSAGYWAVTSTNNGQTWTAPVEILTNAVAPNPARPALAVNRAGHLFMFLRTVSSLPGYSYSTNGGVSWSPPVLYDSLIIPGAAAPFGAVPGSTSAQYVYAQGFYDPGTQSLFYAIGQGSFTAAAIFFQQVLVP